jgi:hypothetical protein
MLLVSQPRIDHDGIDAINIDQQPRKITLAPRNV